MQMKEKTKTITNALFYVAILIGLIIISTEYFLNFITVKIFFRGIIVFISCVFLYLLIHLILRKFLNLFKIITIAIVFAFSLFYIRYFYIVDLVIVAIPKGYKGDVSLHFNNMSSKNKVQPTNGILVLKINKSGDFTTKSNLNIKLTKIALAETVNGELHTNKALRLTNLQKIYPNFIRGLIIQTNR